MQFLCDDGRNSLERRLYGEWMWYLTGKRKPVEYRQRYEAVLDEVEEELSRSPGPFFMVNTGTNGGGGVNHPTLADIKFIPFLERQASSLMYYKGFNVRDEKRWPNLVQWFEAMEARPSYRPTKSCSYTHSRALPPQLGSGCTFGDGCEEMRDAIDAYCLPASEESTRAAMEWRERGWEAYYESDENSSKRIARREAAERIISNQERICKFAARAAGTPGFPAASAELADPKAESNEFAQVAVDVFLRYTVDLLLDGNENGDNKSMWMMMKKEAPTVDMADKVKESKSLQMASEALAKGGDMTVQATIDCLDYLRQRIGVPRDMSYPAAQELREALLAVSTLLVKRGILTDGGVEEGMRKVAYP